MFDTSARTDSAYISHNLDHDTTIAASECMMLARRAFFAEEPFDLPNQSVYLAINASDKSAMLIDKAGNLNEVNPGDMFVVAPGCRLNGTLQTMLLQFDLREADDFAYNEFSQTLSSILGNTRVAAGGDALNIAQALEKALNETEQHWFLYVEGLSRLLVLKSLQNFLNQRSNRSTRMLAYADLDTIVDYVKANYSQDICLETITSLTNMSTSYLSRLFKRYLAVSPMHLVNNFRIEKAKQLLRTETQSSVAEIAHAVGFSDHPHFGKIFKKQVGTSPGVYRKGGQKGSNAAK